MTNFLRIELVGWLDVCMDGDIWSTGWWMLNAVWRLGGLIVMVSHGTLG